MPSSVVLLLRPKKRFEITTDNGYQLHAAILGVLKNHDPELSRYLHDMPSSSFSISSLCGKFQRCGRDRYKIVLPENLYETRIGVIDTREEEVSKSIVDQLLFSDLNGNMLELNDGIFSIEECQYDTKTFHQILTEAKSFDQSIKVIMSLRTPTCIRNGISERYYRSFYQEAIFTSLLSKWNNNCPTESKLSFTRDEISRYVIEQPDPQSYQLPDVVVHTYTTRDGCLRSVFKPGFMGKCTFWFSTDAPENIRIAVIALSIFAKYSGIGIAVSRGCGRADVVFSGTRGAVCER